MRWVLSFGLLALLMMPTDGLGRPPLTGPRVPGHGESHSSHGVDGADGRPNDDTSPDPEPAEPECPVELGVPASQWEVACWYERYRKSCVAPLSREGCDIMNDVALRLGLISQEAYDWLTSPGNDLCAVVASSQVVAICPRGFPAILIRGPNIHDLGFSDSIRQPLGID